MSSVCVDPRRAPGSARRSPGTAAATPPPGSWPKMIVSPSHENAAEWPVGLLTFGGPAAISGDHVVVEEPRVVARAAVLAAEAPDREADAAGAGRLVRAAEDDGRVVAGEVVRRAGLPWSANSKCRNSASSGRLSGTSTMSMPSHARARRGAVDEQAAVAQVRHAGRRVRAAGQVDAGDEVRVARIADVEDVQALEAAGAGGRRTGRRNRLTVAGRGPRPSCSRPRCGRGSCPRPPRRPGRPLAPAQSR